MDNQLAEIVELEEIIAFLEQPASYSHRPQSVKIIQTHISIVAIAAPYVYKLKKPVNFGFLDFSTLEKRLHACQEEVRLNRRLCANTYEGVVAISMTNDGLTFEEEGDVIDYVVKMKLLPEEFFLDQMLSKGEVTHTHIDRIIDVLESFYSDQKPTPGISKYGQVEYLKVSTDENFAQTYAFVDDLIFSSVFRALRYYTDQFYQAHAELFERRVRQGRIRDCHGDLHLEHIHFSPAGICVYDCIEFNERFRFIDIANDVAFLAMDLEHKGVSELSRYLCDQISLRLADPELLDLVPFYKSYRAYVRGKVAAMKSKEEEVDEAGREQGRREAKSYFQLALQSAIQATKPVVIVMMGRIGTGKSTQARMLAEATGWPLLSSDIIRKELAGIPIYTRGSSADRKNLYAKEMTNLTYHTLFEKAKDLVESGQHVILDATFSSKRHRDQLRDLLNTWDVSHSFFEVTASDDTIKERLAGREQSNHEVSDARLEDFQVISRKHQALSNSESRYVVSVSSEVPLQETTFEILRHLVSLNLAA